MSGPPDYVTPFAQAAQIPQPQVGASFMTGMQQGLQMQLARQQVARQLSQQQQLDAARQQFIASPTPQSVRALAALDPQGFSAIKDAHAQQSTDQQKQDLTDLAAVSGNLQAGRKDDALAIVNQRIQANTRAGQDTTSLQHLADAIQQNPDQAKGMVNYSLAAILGPDKFAESFSQIGGEQRAETEEPGKIALTAAQTAQATASAAESQAKAQTTLNPLPKTAATPGPDGNPIFYNPEGPPPAGAGGTGGSPALAALIPKLIGSENSTGDPGAKNPNSSATGNGQFINSTWLQQVKSLRPDLAQGKTDAQILAMRADPNLSAQVTTAYAQQNASTLQAAGLPVNGATIAMAHKLGPGGAQAVLTANPNAALTSVLPPEVIKANPQLAKLTAGQYAQGLAKQFGTDPINTAPDPSATGDDFLATLPPGRAKLIKAIANGDQPGPSGRAAATGMGQALMQQVLQYDPTASAINLASRQATRIAFTKGPEGQAINSLNTVTGHLVGLDNAIAKLDNTGLDWVNGPAQFLGQHLGNKDTQKAVAAFNVAKTNVANELTKVFRGSNGAESDIKGWMVQLDSAKSPTALHATVQTMVASMQSRIDALTNQYSVGMGKIYQTVPGISPHTMALLSSLSGGGSGGAAAPTVAKNAQGQTVVYDPVTRAWKPG